MSAPFDIKQYLVNKEPFYQPQGGEIELYTAAYSARLPVMLKGPTGCGKTRFVSYMAWRLGRPLVGLANYAEAVADPRFWRAILHTVSFTTVSVGIELGLGLAVGFQDRDGGRQIQSSRPGLALTGRAKAGAFRGIARRVQQHAGLDEIHAIMPRQVAEERNVALETILEAILAPREEALQAAVAAGRITQEQADAMLAQMREHIQTVVGRYRGRIKG